VNVGQEPRKEESKRNVKIQKNYFSAEFQMGFLLPIELDVT
jgi:hypothetical protein